MATIRERKPGVWEVRAFLGRDDRGRPVQLSRTVRGGKRDAQRVAAELTTRSVTASARVTVGELLNLWVEQQSASWAVSTAANQRSRVKLVQADPIAGIPLVRLTAVDVDRWHVRMSRAGVGESSVRNRHLVLRAAVTQAVRWGWTRTNVVAVARLGRRKRPPRGALAVEDVRRVMAAAERLADAGKVEPAAPVALRLAALTGARRSELAALRWEDVDGERLTIDSSLVIVRHGSREDRLTPTLLDEATKTANRRTVTLDAATVDRLGALSGLYGSLGPWVLSAGERPLNPERMGAWWRRARDAAGVDKGWRLHDLRHWSATMAIAQGHDIRKVANRLGHANPAMTLRVYAHAVDSNDQPLARSLGAVLDATPSSGLPPQPILPG